jgi:hypothetical protein
MRFLATCSIHAPMGLADDASYQHLGPYTRESAASSAASSLSRR